MDNKTGLRWSQRKRVEPQEQGTLRLSVDIWLGRSWFLAGFGPFQPVDDQPGSDRERIRYGWVSYKMVT